MAADLGERTEPATPRRRSEARARGQVARSHDLAAAVLLLAGFIALEILGPNLGENLLQCMKRNLAPAVTLDPQDVWSTIAPTLGGVAERTVLFLLLMFAAALAVMYAQIGPLYTGQPLSPTLAKINPLSGLQRLFSASSLVLAATNVFKLLVAGLVAYAALAGGLSAIIYAFTLEFPDLFFLGSRLTLRLGLALSAALFVLSLLDYAWQRYQLERRLRMTKEEVKDELRSMEGDPAIKRRRRQLQMRLSLQRIRKDVPKADVVVTNPTHYAVALAYDSETMIAPTMLAKGADQLALRIRQVAVEFGVPIVERKLLARTLYETVEVGHYVPERFYRAIAEILAYVYELTGRSPRAAGGHSPTGRIPRGSLSG
jgi:flagellar biosynthetic protein FlhB